MAASPNQLSLTIFLLFTLLSTTTTHARDSQFFNKVPATTTTEQLPNNQDQEPDFVVPDKENSYGLYSHETGQLPPSTTTTQQPLNKHLPKNYNPVAYVTQPDDMTTENSPSEQKSFATNPTNYYNAANTNQNYYDTQLEQEQEQPDQEDEQYNANKFDNNYSLGSSFNSPQRVSKLNTNTNNNGYRPQPQGMSDTRFLDNGKYFYDVNTEKYNNNHPYEVLKSRNQYSGNRNFYTNRGNNGYEFQNNGGYENKNYQDKQFQNEEEINYNMP